MSETNGNENEAAEPQQPNKDPVLQAIDNNLAVLKENLMLSDKYSGRDKKKKLAEINLQQIHLYLLRSLNDQLEKILSVQVLMARSSEVVKQATRIEEENAVK